MKKFLFVLVLSVCSLCAKSQSFSDGFKNQYIKIEGNAYLSDITRSKYDWSERKETETREKYYSLLISYNFYSSKTIDFESGAAFRFSVHACSKLLDGPMFINTFRYKPFEICYGVRPYIQVNAGIANIYLKDSEKIDMDFAVKLGLTGKIFKDKIDIGTGLGIIGEHAYLVASAAYYINIHRKNK